MPGGSKQAKVVDETVGEVVLRFLEGENEGVEIRVNPPRELTIGRSEECDIFLGEKKISRKHCRVLVATDGVKAQDLQSTNGSFVNKKKIVEVSLKDGDKLQIGTTIIQVSISRERQVSASIKEISVSKTHDEEPMEAIPLAEIPEPLKVMDEEPEVEVDSPSGVIDSGIESAFDMEPSAEILNPKPEAKPEKGKPLSGNLSAMGLADLLQSLAQNRKSGVLHLRSTREGRITVAEGRVLGAEVGRVDGLKAIYRMLGWNEGEFELHPLPPSFDPDGIKNLITDSTESLLMEGFRQFDELEKIRKGLPQISASLKLKPKFTSPLSKLHPRVLDVLQLILNEGRFEAVMDQSAFSDLETAKIVFYLLKKEYVVAS